MELNHVNLPVADVSATRDFFEKGSDLEQAMTGAKTLEAQISDGTAKTEGDDLEAGRLDHGRVRFEIMPGTRGNTVLGKGGLIRSG